MKKNNGITLISLVITIIVLLILAGVSITVVVGDNGILTAFSKAKVTIMKEELEIAWISCQVDYLNGSLTKEAAFSKTNLNKYLKGNGEIVGDYIYNDGDITLLSYKPNRENTIYNFEVDGKGNITEAIEILPGTKVTHNSKYIESGKQCVIPAGFTLSGKEGEYNINTGVVIYEIPNGVTIDWTNSTQTENARKTYNQFVWVPVSDINDMFICTASKADNRTTLDVNEYDGPCNIELVDGKSKCTVHNSENIAGKLYAMPDGENYDEDKSDQGYINMSYKEPIAEAADATYGVTQAILQEEYNNIAKSVLKNGGFWVGRYETSNLNTDTVKVVAGTTTGLANQTWYTMYDKQKSYADNINCYGGMIPGAAWDGMLRFIDSISYDVTHIGYVAHKSAQGITGLYETGNTDYPSTATVEYHDIAKNIYDLEGNVLEWTTEAVGSYRCGRGGGIGDDQSASFLFDSWLSPSQDFAGDVGTRMAIFIK